MFGIHLHAERHVCGGIGVRGWVAVPVLWDLLLVFVPYEIAVQPGDAEECFELGFVEIAVWLIGGVVGQKVSDEIMCSRGDEDAGEERGEVLRVGSLGDVLVVYVLLP